MVEQKATVKVDDCRQHLSCPGLPLAVYREVAAHLQQVDGVAVELVEQSSQEFDYTQSQVEALWIQYPANASVKVCQQVDRILTYYGDRYGAWLVVSG
ncbi:MAG: hypothetical protein WBB29_01375 [Geitlerinemataceae cyanobacterium]